MEQKDHFDKMFWFCVGLSAYGMVLLTCLIWVPIPKDNVRFADVILGFITGTLVSAAINYLLGGNPSPRKPADVKANTVNAENIENVNANTVKTDGSGKE